jgi:2-polyprenyl-3-methyl-5-hydroxy-6-metoxy-1,4-benzoquinol methylase
MVNVPALNLNEATAPVSPPASFRDPAGRLFEVQGRMLRAINSAGAADFNAFMASSAAHKLTDGGQLVHTEPLDRDEALNIFRNGPDNLTFLQSDVVSFVEHEKIAFPSYPHEWSPGMLFQAGCLTLDVAEEILPEGFGLKDATPHNILFRGFEPVFIDLLSFERRDLGDSTWLPYGQFVRTFLLPLLLNKHFRIPLDQIFLGRRDGIEPEEVYRYCGVLQSLRPPFLTLAAIPTWLAAKNNQTKSKIYQKRSLANHEKAQFILRSVLRRLRRSLRRLEPAAGRRSSWSDYMISDCNYSKEHFAAKHAFVERIMSEFSPRHVLDVGCNTGYFSALGAKHGARVVAIDYNPEVVDQVYRNASTERHNILPLVVNLARPSPGLGWRNRECRSFLERARGAFDAVLMLAVVHHMLVTEGIPLSEIIELSAELTRSLLVVEFIAPEDAMFRRLTRGRDALYANLTPAIFESICRQRYEIIRSQHLENTNRWLYLLRKKALYENA